MKINKQLGFVPVAIILAIITALVASGGIYYFNLYNKDKISKKISNKNIEITIPSDALKRGETYPIKWSSNVDVSNLKIELSSGGSSNGKELASNLTDKSGVYDWSVPKGIDVLDGRYRIKIIVKTPEYERAKAQYDEFLIKLRSGDKTIDTKNISVLKQKIEENIISEFSDYFVILENNEVKFINSDSISNIIRNESYNSPGGLAPFGITYEFNGLPRPLKENDVLYFSYSDDVASSVNNACSIKKDESRGIYSCYVSWSSNLYQFDNKSNYSLFTSMDGLSPFMSIKEYNEQLKEKLQQQGSGTVEQASNEIAYKKFRDARRISDVKQLQLAAIMYYDAHNNNYPATLDFLVPTYIPKLPKDPKTGESYKYAALGSGTNCTAYHIGATLEDSSSVALNSDADAAAGAICADGGVDFSGADPVYDLKP